MKFKKIFIGFLVITLMFIFSINVNAETYTHSYINPNRTIDNVNAATYAFYNMFVPPGEYSYYESSVQKSFDSHIKLLTFSDLGEYTEYSQVLVYFDESTFTKVKYNDYYYIFFKKYRYSLKKYRQNNITKEMETLGGASYNSLTGTTSFRNYRFGLKLKDDYSSFSFNQDLPSTINNVDDLAVTGFSSSSWCYSNFYEVTSTLNLLGETFVNNADIQNPSYNGTVLSDKQQFIKWIIANEKYTVFGDYGIENTAQFVDDIVNLYERFNKNPLSLFVSVPQFLIKNGSVFATVDKAKELINYVSALYQEFKLERRPVIYEPELLPYIFPQPWVDNEPNEKYVDDETDTIDVSLLREILRVLIVMPQNIFNFFDYYMYNISVNTSLLADYVAQLPQYLSDLIYNNFFEDINYIKNALDNLPSGSGGGSDLINVEITTEKETEINTFFNDWNIQFSNKINEKIPIIPQLHTLFFTFWEQTNVIKNENELPVYNYNQFLNDSDALTAITGVFDNSNKDYLTNINSPFIPSLTIRIGGVSHEIINFKFYAKYRRWIHNLITFILWFSFLLSLYKSIPNIIGRVAGLDKFIDTKNEGVKDDSIVDSYYISDRKD